MSENENRFYPDGTPNPAAPIPADSTAPVTSVEPAAPVMPAEPIPPVAPVAASAEPIQPTAPVPPMAQPYAAPVPPASAQSPVLDWTVPQKPQNPIPTPPPVGYTAIQPTFHAPSPEFSAPDNAQTPDSGAAYHWSYAEHLTTPPLRRRKAWPFAIIMTAVFLVSFALLIAVLWIEGNTPEGILRPGVSTEHENVAVDGVEQALYYTVVIEATTPQGLGTGTGIVMTKDGYIATNNHVIEGASSIQVTFYDGRTATADLVGGSEMDDLAVIKVAMNGLTPAVFAKDQSTYVGQTVYAVGTPGGADFSWTVTKGIISYKDREIKLYDDDDFTLLKKMRVIQTDANVNPGNSGGPLINTDGEVVGVVSMKLAEGYEGIGFAIPSDGAVEILTAIMEGRLDDVQSSVSHKRPMLGILCHDVQGGCVYVESEDQLIEISEEEIGNYPSSQIVRPAVTGVWVKSVTEGMDSVGKIEHGDIITAVNDIDVTSRYDLSDIINDHYAGDTITITFYRNGLYNHVEITLSAQSDTE